MSAASADTHWATLAALFVASAVVTWATVTWREGRGQSDSQARPAAAAAGHTSPPMAQSPAAAPAVPQPAVTTMQAPASLPPAVETVEQHQRQTDKIARGLESNSGGGVRVTAVARNSIASQLRLEPGDVVVSMNGSPVSSPEDFARIYREQGLPSQMTVLHDGREMHHH